MIYFLVCGWCKSGVAIVTASGYKPSAAQVPSHKEILTEMQPWRMELPCSWGFLDAVLLAYHGQVEPEGDCKVETLQTRRAEE